MGGRSPARLHLSPRSPPDPGGGPHSSCVQGSMASQGDLVLSQSSPRGAPCPTLPVCGWVSSQDELRSAIYGPGSAQPGPAGPPVPQRHLSTCKLWRPLLPAVRRLQHSGSPAVPPGLPSDTLQEAVLTGPRAQMRPDGPAGMRKENKSTGQCP